MPGENAKKYLLIITVLAIGLFLSACIHRTSEFEKKFPRPEWWGLVSDGKRINSYAELQLLWQKSTNDDLRKFIKTAYITALHNPEDADILLMSIYLFPICDPDYPHLVPLLEFALENHFNYIDRSCGASPADRIAGIVKELATQYLRRKEYEKTVLVIERLLYEKETEVNHHLLEGLSQLYADALFYMGKETEAIHVLECAIVNYNGGWEKDLREQLAMFQDEVRNRTGTSPASGK